MRHSFGPWTTAIHGGSAVALSAFWKSRMGRLAAVGRAPASNYRNAALLFVVGVATCLLPTIRGVVAQEEDETNTAAPAAKSAGRIYLQAVLRPEKEGDEDVEDIRGIIAVDPETGQWRQLTEYGHGVRVSPDGQTLIFTRDGATWNCDSQEAAGPGQIADLSGKLSWTDDGAAIVVADGQYIEAEGQEEGWRHENWKISADGLTRTELSIPATDAVEDVSPDGKWVVTTTDRHPPKGRGYQLYVMRPDGSEQTRITHGGLNVYARFSPDGKRIAYVYQDKNGNALKTVNTDGGNEKTLLSERGFADSPDGADWSPDGSQLAVVRFDWGTGDDGKRQLGDPAEANYRLEIIDADGGPTRRVDFDGVRIVWLGHPDWQ